MANGNPIRREERNDGGKSEYRLARGLESRSSAAVSCSERTCIGADESMASWLETIPTVYPNERDGAPPTHALFYSHRVETWKGRKWHRMVHSGGQKR